jgi:hypothetical protein
VTLAAQGHRYILAAALRDNIKLAMEQEAAGVGHQQQAWMGKATAYLNKCGIIIDLPAAVAAVAVASTATTAAATPILILRPWEVEAAEQQQYLQKLIAATGTKIQFYKQKIRGWTGTATINLTDYKMQPHLKTVMPWRRRRELSRFRTSSHFLRVEMDRYQYPQVPHNTRLCRLCNSGAVEDEEHMVFGCTNAALVQLRQDYNSLFSDNSDSAVTTLPALLQQPQRQLSAFIMACFTAGDYETRNQHPPQAIRAARTSARTAAAAVPVPHL